MAEINRIQRQRLATLMQREVDTNGLLSPAERGEMVALQRLGAMAPDASMRLVKQWADVGSDTMRTPQRSRVSGRQRVVQTLEMRWPRQPLSGTAAQLELLRMRGEWHLTPWQRQLQRMRQRWAT